MAFTASTTFLGINLGVFSDSPYIGQRKLWLPGVIGRTIWDAGRVSRERQDDVIEIPIDFGIPEFPVEVIPTAAPEPEAPGVYQVLPREEGGDRRDYPPAPSAWDPPTEEEQEEGGYTIISTELGDFPLYGEAHDLDTEEEPIEMAHDWGHLFREGIGSIFGIGEPEQQWNAMGPAFAAVASSPIPSGQAASLPSAAPVITANGVAECGNRRYVTLDRQTGKISCRRRRRRRLLTNRDLADLASLKTITGGGAALNAAVIRAVR